MDPSELLRDRFGFADFLPGQRKVIDALLAHGRALAVFPTGGGKSICYQLPALAWSGTALVVSPLIALMKDQIDFLHRRGVAAARIDSSMSPDELRETARALEAGTLKLLYVAPERFQNERFLQMLGRAEISLFAIDEAHCISEWGHNFRPDYLKLAETARALRVPRVLALTATATPAVAADIAAAFAIPEAGVVVTGFYRENLELRVAAVGADERDATLLARLRDRPAGPTIVYVTLQKTAERVAEALARAGLPAQAYHAGMTAEERAAVQDHWMASERGVVVATIAFGMGIDKADVRYVYHYNLPKSLESYSQEIGRAGRDGGRSIVEVLACADDVPTLENFAYGDTPTDRSLRGLVADVLGRGARFDVGLTELSDRHDIRILVVRTALTYLELLGELVQGTPHYAGYRVRPLLPPPEIAGHFRGEHAEFVAGLFEHAKRGRIWFTVDPEQVARAMGQDRARVVRALEVLEERGYAELSASDLRHRYSRTPRADGAAGPAPDDARVAELTQEIRARFARREAQEIARLAQVLELLSQASCIANGLVAHFGEVRERPCGRCSACTTARGVVLPTAAARPLPGPVDAAALDEVRAAHAGALSEPRQVARFLCGLSSPALTRAKLSRHPLFGALGEWRFADVLAWCSA